MGQQQLLLVILVTIIVGIATVVAINTFGAAAEQTAVDAVRLDLLTIGASSQSFYMRPRMLGGGGRSFNNPPITFQNVAFGGSLISSTEAENENGIYTIEEPQANEFIISAQAKTTSPITMQARVCPNDIKMGDLEGNEPLTCDNEQP